MIILLNLAFSTEKTVGCSRSWKDSLTYEHAHVDCINLFFFIGKNRAKIINKKKGKKETRFPTLYRKKPSLYDKEKGGKKTPTNPTKQL